MINIESKSYSNW